MGSFVKMRSRVVCRAQMVVMMLTVMMMSATKCRAEKKMNINKTYSCINGGCGLIADDAEVELLMESQISRLLLSPGGSVAGGSFNRDKPVVDCGRNEPNNKCTPNPNKPKKGENCSGTSYNRGC